MLYVITLEEIATELRIEQRSAAHAVRRLRQSHGFPPPLPGLTTRWSRHLVGQWFRTNGGQVGGMVASPVAANDEAPVDPIAAHTAHLNAMLGINP